MITNKTTTASTTVVDTRARTERGAADGTATARAKPALVQRRTYIVYHQSRENRCCTGVFCFCSCSIIYIHYAYYIYQYYNPYLMLSVCVSAVDCRGRVSGCDGQTKPLHQPLFSCAIHLCAFRSLVTVDMSIVLLLYLRILFVVCLYVCLTFCLLCLSVCLYNTAAN